MNLTHAKYKDFALVKEMMETPEIIRNFNFDQTAQITDVIRASGRLFLTGEGSSRIFPAKSAITLSLKHGMSLVIATDGCRQAHEYNLTDWTVFGASNSGKTKELVSLFDQLHEAGNDKLFGLTANADTPLQARSNDTIVLTCGKEDAVAATKSVVEQALVYRSILCRLMSCDCVSSLGQAADLSTEVLSAEYDADIIAKIAAAPVIYFAGRNNGVAEELTLKTNEITRKKSDYLEGTYAVHGIEEVMNPDEVVIVVDPYDEECEKFKEVLVDGVGMTVVAISSKKTIFPTIKIPALDGYNEFFQLMAGWNILVQVGVANGIDLDTPQRARKIGNEVVG